MPWNLLKCKFKNYLPQCSPLEFKIGSQSEVGAVVDAVVAEARGCGGAEGGSFGTTLVAAPDGFADALVNAVYARAHDHEYQCRESKYAAGLESQHTLNARQNKINHRRQRYEPGH